MKQIYTSKAPEPIGPYSQAIEIDNFVFLSGQIALKDGVLQNENIEIETQQVLQNIEEILREAKIEKENIVKTTIFLKDLNDFQKVNQIYKEWLGEHKPARSTIEVSKLPLNAKIEIEVIAVK